MKIQSHGMHKAYLSWDDRAVGARIKDQPIEPFSVEHRRSASDMDVRAHIAPTRPSRCKAVGMKQAL
jgi:hypothetical protein